MRKNPRPALVLLVGAVVTACGQPSPSPSGPSATAAIPSGAATASAPSGTPAPTPSPTPSPTPGPTASPTPGPDGSAPWRARIAFERQVTGSYATEPVVAAHPTDPQRLAVSYYRHTTDGVRIGPGLRISHDGGRTWREATGRPWRSSGRGPGSHPSIAWGPGPTPGSARLYWADTTYGGHDGHRLSVAWSDDEGRTWSPLHVERRTPPWIGGFPDITVDLDPASPNHGVAYVTYNWLADAESGPGFRLLASADFGATWAALEIPKATAPDGYPAAWRIGGRVRAAPGGSVLVACFQADLRTWRSGDPFRKGPWGNAGRVGYAVTRVVFDRVTGTFASPATAMATTMRPNAWTAYSGAAPGTDDNLVDAAWSMSLDVDRASGRILLATGDYQPAAAGVARGTVRVGRSDDGGTTWSWVALPPLAEVAGRPQSSFRPSIAVSGRVVVVGLRGIMDVAVGTDPAKAIPTIGAAIAISVDGGETFAAPTPISGVRWNAMALRPETNGPGLRERAARLADGSVVYVYADGRLADPAPSETRGRAAVFAAVVRVWRVFPKPIPPWQRHPAFEFG